MDSKTTWSIIIAILFFLLFIVNYYTTSISNFVMNDEFKRKANELFKKKASFTEFRSHYNIDNVEYVDLKNEYIKNGSL